MRADVGVSSYAVRWHHFDAVPPLPLPSSRISQFARQASDTSPSEMTPTEHDNSPSLNERNDTKMRLSAFWLMSMTPRYRGVINSWRTRRFEQKYF